MKRTRSDKRAEAKRPSLSKKKDLGNGRKHRTATGRAGQRATGSSLSHGFFLAVGAALGALVVGMKARR